MNPLSTISPSQTLYVESKPVKLIEQIKNSVSWVIHERGGFAKLAGMGLVPSQFLCPNLATSKSMVSRWETAQPSQHVSKMERIEIAKGDGRVVSGVILYPIGWSGDSDRCILYHNPNGVTLPQCLARSAEFDVVPLQLLQKMKCPVVMYDYSGTGISREAQPQAGLLASYNRFLERPSAHTVSEDGSAMLEYAMNRFSHVDSWGSSLGGGVATIACAEYLKKNPEAADRLRLFNHDSFTTTGKAVLPSFLTGLVTAAGANLDAETPMRQLAARGLDITILCHRRDPVIPAGARMAEIAGKIGGNITLIESPLYGHANLSFDMIERLDRR